MNLLFVYPFSKIAEDIYTGTTTNLLRFCEALKTKYNIYILSDYINEKYNEVDTVLGMKTYRMRKYFYWPIGEIYRRIIILPKLVKKLVKLHNIDIIYYLFDPANFTYLSGFFIANINKPTIFQLDMNPYLYIDWPIQRKILKKASAFHSLSNCIKNMFVSKGFEEEKIFTIHNTINVSKYKPENAKKFREKFGIEKEDIIITYVKGREYIAKKFLKEVKPILDMKYDCIKYCFIGNFKKIPTKNRNKNTIFTGILNEDLFLDALASTDIALELRGGGWSVLTRPMEYAASGCAIVMPYSQAINEQFEDEKEILFSPTTINSKEYGIRMANSISRLIEDDKLRNNIKKNVRNKTVKNFSYEITIKKFEKIFGYILQ